MRCCIGLSVLLLTVACDGKSTSKTKPATSGKGDAPSAVEAPAAPPKSAAPPCTEARPIGGSLPELRHAREPLAEMPGAKRATFVAVGEAGACAIDCDGRALCWDMVNEMDEEEAEESGEALAPLAAPEWVLEGTALSSIGVGARHLCALTAEGAPICYGWTGSGHNSEGQLGSGDTSSAEGPVAVRGVVGARALSIARNSSCAINEREVYCWGENEDDILGLGTEGATPSPAVVSGITSLSVGHAHACAVATDGTVRCVGDSGAHVLGCESGSEGCDGRGTAIAKRPAIPNPAKVSAVAVGMSHSCSLNEKGEVHCWGEGHEISEAREGKDALWKPRKVEGLPPVRAMAAGDFHSCALSEDGSLYCWGSNSYGEIGNAEIRGSSIATKVEGLPALAQVAAGHSHTCVLTKEGQVLCWGVGQDPR